MTFKKFVETFVQDNDCILVVDEDPVKNPFNIDDDINDAGLFYGDVEELKKTIYYNMLHDLPVIGVQPCKTSLGGPVLCIMVSI